MSGNVKSTAKHNQKMKLKVGDVVRAIAGKNRYYDESKLKSNSEKIELDGDKKEQKLRHEGRILRIDRENRRVLVEGLNIVKKTKKRQKQEESGEIIEKEAYLDVSNVMMLCSLCGPTRIGYNGVGKQKQRICRKCGKVL